MTTVDKDGLERRTRRLRQSGSFRPAAGKADFPDAVYHEIEP